MRNLYEPYSFYKDYVDSVLTGSHYTYFLCGGAATGKTMLTIWLMAVKAGLVWRPEFKDKNVVVMPPCKDGVRRTRSYLVLRKMADIAKIFPPIFEELFPAINFSGLRNLRAPQCVVRERLFDGTTLEWTIIGQYLIKAKQLRSFDGAHMTNIFVDDCALLDDNLFSSATCGVGLYPSKMSYPELYDAKEKGIKAKFNSQVFAAANPLRETRWIFEMKKRNESVKNELFFEPPALFVRGRFWGVKRDNNGKPRLTAEGLEVAKHVSIDERNF